MADTEQGNKFKQDLEHYMQEVEDMLSSLFDHMEPVDLDEMYAKFADAFDTTPEFWSELEDDAVLPTQQALIDEHVTVRAATRDDVTDLAKLSVALWQHDDEAEMVAEYTGLLDDEEAALYIARYKDKPIAFAHVQLRHDYVEGCETVPVAYLEAVYVRDVFRFLGIGKALVEEAEDWARAMGCEEFASDTEIQNDDGFNFHLATGFTEVNRIVCFKKDLYPDTKEEEPEA